MQRILIIVPSYKEEKNILHVIEGLQAHVPELDILIIDDGSKDKTREIADRNGIKTIQHPFNMGYGVSIQTGYKYAVRHGYDVVIQFDGDDQHDPSFVRPLIDALNASGCDVVIGSRFLGTGSDRMAFARRMGITFFSSIASFVTGQKFTDSTSGMQALNRRVFTFFSQMERFPTDYPDADLIITLCFSGFKVKEIPVIMHNRLHGQSMTSGVKTLIYVIKMLISILITLLRKKQLNEYRCACG
ncbi:MAG: glycosyltransferase family 2 protein [Syntrophobacter sp.]